MENHNPIKFLSTYSLGLATSHNVTNGAQLSVDVIVYHGVPLAEAVQSA